METVFSVGLPRGYITRITGQLESELRESLEMAVEDDWEEMARKESGCGKTSLCVLLWQWHCYKSTARIRLVKKENPTVCVMVNCEVCWSVIALQLIIVLSDVYKVSLNPIQNPLAVTPTSDTIMKFYCCRFQLLYWFNLAWTSFKIFFQVDCIKTMKWLINRRLTF
jgi:hypothetical protein